MGIKLKEILTEVLLTEASGTFTKSMAVELTDNVLAYPEGKTKKKCLSLNIPQNPNFFLQTLKFL